MKDLVITHKLDIQDNMDALAETIKRDITEKYDLVVTEDTVTETKKLMAEINKEKDEFKKTYTSFKNAVLAPLTPLDAKAKEIEGYYTQARAVLDAQVKKFEAYKLEKAKEVCIAYLTEQCEAKSISFTAITISDLFVQLGSVTATGNISTKAKTEIDSRIQKVENEILKARLEAEEKAKRDREIAERAREEAEARARQREAELIAKAEREKAEAVEKARQEAYNAPQAPQTVETPKEVQTPAPVKENAPQATNDGKKIYKISFVFEVSAKVGVDSEKLIEKVKSMFLSEIGLQNLKEVLND